MFPRRALSLKPREPFQCLKSFAPYRSEACLCIRVQELDIALVQPDSRVVIRPPCMLGCTSVIGEMTHVTMRLFNRLPSAMTVSATIECHRILKPVTARDVSDKSHQVQLVPIMRTSPNDMSFMSMGVMQGMTLHLPAGGSAVHSFGLCFLVPGLYEIFGSLEPTLADPEGEPPGKAMHVAGTKLYVLVMK